MTKRYKLDKKCRKDNMKNVGIINKQTRIFKNNNVS